MEEGRKQERKRKRKERKSLLVSSHTMFTVCYVLSVTVCFLFYMLRQVMNLFRHLELPSTHQQI